MSSIKLAKVDPTSTTTPEVGYVRIMIDLAENLVTKDSDGNVAQVGGGGGVSVWQQTTPLPYINITNIANMILADIDVNMSMIAEGSDGFGSIVLSLNRQGAGIFWDASSQQVVTGDENTFSIGTVSYDVNYEVVNEFSVLNFFTEFNEGYGIISMPPEVQFTLSNVADETFWFPNGLALNGSMMYNDINHKIKAHINGNWESVALEKDAVNVGYAFNGASASMLVDVNGQKVYNMIIILNANITALNITGVLDGSSGEIAVRNSGGFNITIPVGASYTSRVRASDNLAGKFNIPQGVNEWCIIKWRNVGGSGLFYEVTGLEPFDLVV